MYNNRHRRNIFLKRKAEEVDDSVTVLNCHTAYSRSDCCSGVLCYLCAFNILVVVVVLCFHVSVLICLFVVVVTCLYVVVTCLYVCLFFVFVLLLLLFYVFMFLC